MEKKVVDVPYASGGAGFALSNALMEKLNGTADQCIGRSEQSDWAGDLRVGKCLHDLGARVTHESGFHHEPAGAYPNVAAETPIVSFHHLTVDMLAHYDRIAIVEDRGTDAQLKRWDFSNFYARAYDLTFHNGRRAVHVRFGESVISTVFASGWRQVYSDPLYFRHAVENGEDVFYMQVGKVPHFRDGDGCTARIHDVRLLPRRKSALLRVQCRPCAPHGASEGSQPEFDVICFVRQPNSCMLHVGLALRCPASEPAFAVNLDVGFRSGSSEVVFMGRPRDNVTIPAAAMRQRNVRFYVAVTHGSMTIEDVRLSVAAPRCHAWTRSRGIVIHPEPLVLRVRCACSDGEQLANVTVSLRLHRFSGLIWTYVQRCTASKARRSPVL